MAVPVTQPLAVAGSHVHKYTMPLPNFCLRKGFNLCLCDGGAALQVLMAFWVFRTSSYYPVIFLLIASLFLVDVQESNLILNQLLLLKKGKGLVRLSPIGVHGVLHRTGARPLGLAKPTKVLPSLLRTWGLQRSSSPRATKANSTSSPSVTLYGLCPYPTSLLCSFQSHQVRPATASPARFSRAFPPAPGCSLAQPSGLQTRGYTNTARA